MHVLMPVGEKTSIRADYTRKLNNYDFEPLVVRYGEPWPHIFEQYNRSAGVLLIGGSDVNPVRYAARREDWTQNIDDGRDTLDLTVLDWAYAQRKPIFGICRGLQMMGVHRGQKLRQHLPNHVPDERHSNEAVPVTLAALTDNRILLKPGSRIAHIVGQAVLDVRCAHHQALMEDENPYLRASGYSLRGVPECWESTDSSHFCLGVQFHPEVMSGPSDALFAAFYEASKHWQSNT